jgi:uncharacterized membrane protein
MVYLNVSIDLEKEITIINTTFKFTEDVKEVYFPIQAVVYDIQTKGGTCTFESKLQAIKCKPPSPFMVGQIKIETSFKAKNLIKRQNNISFFSFDIPILLQTDNVYVSVKLPRDMLLTEEVLLPLSPSGSTLTIEGRRVSISWKFENKKPGDIIPLRIYYEYTRGFPGIDIKLIITNIRWIIFLLIITIIVVAMMFYRRMKESKKLVLSVLNEDERLIMNLIAASKGKIDQRKLVSLSGFSKAKVSRLVHDLQKRGLLKIERVGRRNRITLKKFI